MKTTIAAIETAVGRAEDAIKAYATEKSTIYSHRDAGELTYAAAEKARLFASIPADRAVKTLRAMGDTGAVEVLPDALLARCDAVDGWRE